MFRLVPVVEVRSVEEHFWCPLPAAPWPAHVELSGSSSESDVALVLLQLATCNSGASDEDMLSAAGLVCCESLILPGGLAVRDADREILPSCCSGLEQWHEWQLALTDDVSPWMGHDPSPGIVFHATGGHVWPDGEGTEAERPRVAIAFRRDELAVQLGEVRARLEGFAARVETVISRYHPGQARGLAEMFHRIFISPAE